MSPTVYRKEKKKAESKKNREYLSQIEDFLKQGEKTETTK